MQRLILKLTGFFLGGAALLALARETTQTLSMDYRNGAAIVCEAKRDYARRGLPDVQGKARVLFIGNSRLLAGVIPKVFDEETGTTDSYNMALLALPIGPSYFLLRDYLESNPPPEYVCLDLDVDYGDQPGLFDYYAVQGAAPGEILTYGLERPDRNVVYNYLFPTRMYQSELANWARDRLLAPGNLERMHQVNLETLEELRLHRGYYFIEGAALFDDQRLPDEFGAGAVPEGFAPTYDIDRSPFVARFFDLALDEGITVILIQAAYARYEYRQWEAPPAHTTELLERYPNVRLADGGHRLRIYENRYFADSVHLNREGADRYSREIAREFLELTK